MDKLRDISSIQEEADAKICLCARYCVLLGGSSVCIDTYDTDVLVLPLYLYGYVNNHFLTRHFPLYIGIPRKLEEHLLNVSNVDYENSV